MKKSSVKFVLLAITTVAGGGGIIETQVAFASAAAPVAVAADERSYAVDALRFEYVHAFPELPSPEALLDWEIELGIVADGYIAPQPNVESTMIALRDLGRDGRPRLYESAIDSIANMIRQRLEAQVGPDVFVAVDDRHIDPVTGDDVRRRRDRTLNFRIEYTGPSYLIESFSLAYLFEDIEGHPDIAALEAVQIPLVPTEQHGYVAWRPGIEPVRMTLAEIAHRPVENYSAAGVQQVLVTMRDALVDAGLMAVRVTPSQQHLDRARQDATTIPLVIVTGLVSEMRTLAAGERIDPGPERINHRIHSRIRDRSPVQPGVPGRQLLQRQDLDNYIYHLSRHPGRRVDISIAPGDPIEIEPDVHAPTLTLDYLVTENKPWLVYVQGSNTGTPQTGRWRQRFGFYHSQLTNHDDIFNVDYVTTGFKDSHAVNAFYEAPFFFFDWTDRLRFRIHGHWSEFDASEVGFPGLRFTGESWSAGGELIFNIYQDRQLFIDILGGGRYFDTRITNFFNDFIITEGREDFFLPYAGVRAERITEVEATHGSLIFEGNIAGISGVDEAELNQLGRLFPDKDWLVMRWDLTHSFYLEPVLNPSAWEDVATPDTSTLAHEIALGFRGQYAFGNRLIPQLSMVAGGLHTVRGYPESIAAGDTVLIGSAEYRFHLPRALRIQEDPGRLLGQPFRWRPQHVYGHADWDLILLAFIDVGRTIQHDKFAFEDNHTLVGTGIGVEFQFRRNLNVRLDWGFALKGIEDRVNSGSNRLHFIGTLLF